MLGSKRCIVALACAAVTAVLAGAPALGQPPSENDCKDTVDGDFRVITVDVNRAGGTLALSECNEICWVPGGGACSETPRWVRWRVRYLQPGETLFIEVKNRFRNRPNGRVFRPMTVDGLAADAADCPEREGEDCVERIEARGLRHPPRFANDRAEFTYRLQVLDAAGDEVAERDPDIVIRRGP